MRLTHLDQAFTTDNLRREWDFWTRRGKALPQKLVRSSKTSEPLLSPLFNNVESRRTVRIDLRDANRSNDAAAKETSKALLKELSVQRDEFIAAFLKSKHVQINRGSFRIRIRPGRIVRGTQTFDLDEPYAANYLAERIVQRSLRTAFKVTQSGRNQIIGQLLAALDDTVPKVVSRGDVESFYESVPHEPLMKLLTSNPLLATNTIRQVRTVLESYAAHSGTAGRGLPRGLGLSAVLSEIYMRSFDASIQALPETIYYARFVDDFVAVFSRTKPSTGEPNYLDAFRVRLSTIELSLTNKQGKRHEHFFGDERELKPFVFLGYHFEYFQGQLRLALSSKRMSEMARRINLCFDAYEHSRYPTGRSRQLLIQRVSYLTSNTRLHNNKRNAFVGIFFSNPYAMRQDQFRLLDALLRTRLSKLTDSSLVLELSTKSFHEGHSDRTFRLWKPSELNTITSLWRNVD